MHTILSQVTFQNILTETTIDLRITVTLNQATGFIEVQIILKPVRITHHCRIHVGR